MKRLKEIFKEHNPSKISQAARLISKHRNGEHEIYLKVCSKYGVEPAQQYNGPDDMSEPEAESDDPLASDNDEEEEEEKEADDGGGADEAEEEEDEDEDD